MDAKRLARLQQRYGLDYVVVTRGNELDFSAPPVFGGQRFVVYALSSESDAGSLASGNGLSGM